MTQEQKQVFKAIGIYAKQHNVPIIMQSAAAVLCEQCNKKQPKKILEIGMAIGYSGSLMLLSSSADTHLTSIELSTPNIQEATKNFARLNLTERVTILEGDCIEVLSELKDKFDFVFLDGPKALYLDCLPLILRLCTKGAVIVADNMNYSRRAHNALSPERSKRIEQSLEEFKQAVISSPKLKSEFLNIDDGLVVINYLGD